METETMPRKWWRRRLVLLVAAGLILWLGATAVLVFGARASALAGLDELEAIQARATPSTLLSGEETAGLRRAEVHFARARSALRSVPVSPLRALPVVGRQLRSADALIGAAGEVADAGGDALDDAVALAGAGAGTGTGTERARLVAQLAEVAERAERRVVAVDLGPGEALVGPLARARDEAVETVEELEAGLGRVRVATAGLAELFQGSSRYLLLVGNNAEMRAGSGMFLTVGTVNITDGSFRVGEIVPTFDFQLPESVPIEGDLADRWGWLEPGREWRNLGVTPRFDVTAPLAARMWAQAKGQTVDGVLAVDVLALQALLAVTGPVEVEGQTIDADTVVEDLLHDQYVGLDSQDDVAQSERRSRLGGVVQAAVEALERPDIDFARLVEELAEVAQGRHLLAWSPEPAAQLAWEAMGLDGTLEGDELLVSVLNRGGNKLDPYLEVSGDVTVETGPDTTAVTVEVTFENTVGADEPSYILGPSPPLQVPSGTYVGLVAATLPATATGGRFDGYDSLAVAGADGPTRVVAVPLEVPRGERRIVTLRFELPPGPGSIDVLPSARVPSISWVWQDQSWRDHHAESLSF